MKGWHRVVLITLVAFVALTCMMMDFRAKMHQALGQEAGNYITCDSYLAALPAESKPTYFLIFLDGSTTAINSSAVTLTNNDITMRWSIVSLAPGSHTITAQACNDWGCSVPSDPWNFTKGTAPTKPTGLKLLRI